MDLRDIFKRLSSNLELSEDHLDIIFQYFKEKKIKDEDIEKLVVLWREKGETAGELKYLADLLYREEPQIDTVLSTQPSAFPPKADTSMAGSPIVDICGTGGDKANTFNISTLAAIVVSACGLQVIKHSGRSTTSIIGSVDVLSDFGVEIDMAQKIREKIFKKYNLMFVSSKKLREIFGVVKRVCKKLDIPGFVNLLGPVSNPYKTDLQLIGVSRINWGEVLANVLIMQGKNRSIVTCCSIPSKNLILDELTFCGENYLWHISNGKITEEKLLPSDFGKKENNFSFISIKNVDESKAIFVSVLKGDLDNVTMLNRAETVALNSGTVLFLAKKVKSIKEGYYFALECIKSGKAWEHFQNYVNCNKMEK